MLMCSECDFFHFVVATPDFEYLNLKYYQKPYISR